MRFIDYYNKGMARGAGGVAFIDGGTRYAWDEVDAMSARIAAGLHAMAPSDEARIGVYSPNDTRAFACVLGILRADLVWVPINWRNTVHANGHLLELTGCDILLYHSDFAREAQQLAEQRNGGMRLICLDKDTQTGSEFAVLAEDHPGLPDSFEDEDRLVALFPTGGTTGLSKAARWTHRTLGATCDAFWQCLATDEPIVHLVAGPMTHAAGLLALNMMPAAPTHIILKTPDPLSILQAIDQHRVTHLYLPPTLLYALLSHPRVGEFDYSSLRAMVLAAAPVAPEKLREARSVFGPVICQSYGQAEAPMFLTFLPARDLAQAGDNSPIFASCGRETLQARLAIMDDDGAVLPDNTRGEIVARGPLVFPGYHANPEGTKKAFSNGWLRTGDVGYRDPDGYYYIVDRKKDMVVTGGFNVYTAEVEQAVLAHPDVRDCAVFGVPDEKWGEAVKAVVELKPGASFDPESIAAKVKDLLGAVQTPKSVDVWPELPRSGNGKILKREIRDRFWQQQDRQV
ncbi:AMP-binding protein [Rhodobacteraceae bacterium F11138]|nr:AMP-binding protein [Rhodobacteraceae bacterium F11138]